MLYRRDGTNIDEKNDGAQEVYASILFVYLFSNLYVFYSPPSGVTTAGALHSLPHSFY